LINEEGVNSLFLPAGSKADSGIYSCVARNRAGEASFSVQLKVSGKNNGQVANKCSKNENLFFPILPEHLFFTDKDSFKPPYFIEHLANLVIPEGKDAVLSCACTGTPSPYLTWEKDGYTLTPDKEFR
jgi:hypothetical protein